MRKTLHKRNEFRKYKKSGHPAYIYAQIGDDFMFLGITHSPITRGIKNIKLDENPNINDDSVAYIKNNPQRDRQNQFDKEKLPFKLSEQDKKKVDKIIKKK